MAPNTHTSIKPKTMEGPRWSSSFCGFHQYLSILARLFCNNYRHIYSHGTHNSPQGLLSDSLNPKCLQQMTQTLSVMSLKLVEPPSSKPLIFFMCGSFRNQNHLFSLRFSNCRGQNNCYFRFLKCLKPPTSKSSFSLKFGSFRH